MVLGQIKGLFLPFGHLWSTCHLLSSAAGTSNIYFPFKHLTTLRQIL